MSLEALLDNLARVMPEPRSIAMSTVTGAGFSLWLDWLEERHVARAVLTPQIHHGHRHV